MGKAAPRRSERPTGEQLGLVAGDEPDAAMQAALEVMVLGGFVSLSIELD